MERDREPGVTNGVFMIHISVKSVMTGALIAVDNVWKGTIKGEENLRRKIYP